MKDQVWRWVLGLGYIFAVASIWIAASFVVQSVVGGGVSPFLITYICNSLFLVYIPIVEIGRYFEDKYGSIMFWRKVDDRTLSKLADSEEVVLLEENGVAYANLIAAEKSIESNGSEGEPVLGKDIVGGEKNLDLDEKGRWTRTRLAKVSLLICPFWFFAQLTFNLSLKYTSVTSNTILSSTSSLFTFLVSLIFLGEKFTWLKFASVLLCMAGTIIVSLGDSGTRVSAVASNPALGDILALLSAACYSVYVTLIRKKLPDEEDGDSGQASMAQFLGYLGLCNIIIFLPVFLVLNFTKLEPITILTWKQLGLIVGKGLLDNVLSDYLWAKAVLLTTTTVATAGLTIQVPLAAIVDSLKGNAPSFSDYIGATAVMVGFAGMNIPSDIFSRAEESGVIEMENLNNTCQDDLPSR
ncbi:secondary carrier transporter [Lithospermum erythrorhizon]|uniref:Secondary carrier transporter n=1 Tax=Lithospermum erythrorhizon TaxID=34254 RepID=A0AAV3NS37_LITER